MSYFEATTKKPLMQKRGSRRYERKPYYIRNLRKILDGMTLTSIILLTNTKSGN